jgi:hypothetical protein
MLAHVTAARSSGTCFRSVEAQAGGTMTVQSGTQHGETQTGGVVLGHTDGCLYSVRVVIDVLGQTIASHLSLR